MENMNIDDVIYFFKKNNIILGIQNKINNNDIVAEGSQEILRLLYKIMKDLGINTVLTTNNCENKTYNSYEFVNINSLDAKKDIIIRTGPFLKENIMNRSYYYYSATNFFITNDICHITNDVDTSIMENEYNKIIIPFDVPKIKIGCTEFESFLSNFNICDFHEKDYIKMKNNRKYILIHIQRDYGDQTFLKIDYEKYIGFIETITENLELVHLYNNIIKKKNYIKYIHKLELDTIKKINDIYLDVGLFITNRDNTYFSNISVLLSIKSVVITENKIKKNWNYTRYGIMYNFNDNINFNEERDKFLEHIEIQKNDMQNKCKDLLFMIYNDINKENIKIYNENSTDLQSLNYMDIYYDSDFCKLSEISDGGVFNIIIWKNKIIYPFIKKGLYSNKYNKMFYHLCPPPGYSGPCKYSNALTLNDDDILDFERDINEYCKKNCIITECIRYSPYNNDVIYKKNNTNIQLRAKSVIVDLKLTYDNYLKKCSKSHIRTMRSCKERGFNAKYIENPTYEDIKYHFIYLYEQTMRRTNANKYYFYTDEYYIKLAKYLKNNTVLFYTTNKDDKTVACCIYFCYGKYMNYHLGGSDVNKENRGLNDILHDCAIKYGMERGYEILHLGYGMNYDDPLFHFKKQIGTGTVDYYIVKNIFNKEMYESLCEEFCKDPGDIKFFPAYMF